jgi:hypothetical protein
LETKSGKIIFIFLLFVVKLSAQIDAIITSEVIDTIRPALIDTTTHPIALDSSNFDKSPMNIKPDTISHDPIYLLNDSLKVFNLQEVIVFNKPKFDTYADRRRYYITQRRVIKVYPYAKLAAENLAKLEERLAKIDSRRNQKKYIKIVGNYIKNEYEPILKKFTTTEGKILLKLFYRQTGKTTFETLKHYQSGWNAFWYNVGANIFDLSLKSKYNPFKYKEDHMIEYILRDQFDRKRLEYQEPFWSKLDMKDEFFEPLTPEQEKELKEE